METPSFEAIEKEINNILDLDAEELDDETKVKVESYLNELARQEEEKIDGFAYFIRQSAAQADFLKEESKKLAAKAKTLENRIDWMKNHYMKVMTEAGVQKLKGKTYTVSIRKTASVLINEDKEIPDEFMRIKTIKEPDKIAIKEKLKAGEQLTFATLFNKPSLQIR